MLGRGEITGKVLAICMKSSHGKKRRTFFNFLAAVGRNSHFCTMLISRYTPYDTTQLFSRSNKKQSKPGV